LPSRKKGHIASIELRIASIELRPNDLACRTSRVGLTPFLQISNELASITPHVDGMLLGQVVKDNVVRVTDL
jgi:hypothetical protein